MNRLFLIPIAITVFGFAMSFFMPDQTGNCQQIEGGTAEGLQRCIDMMRFAPVMPAFLCTLFAIGLSVQIAGKLDSVKVETKNQSPQREQS